MYSPFFSVVLEIYLYPILRGHAVYLQLIALLVGASSRQYRVSGGCRTVAVRTS